MRLIPELFQRLMINLFGCPKCNISAWTWHIYTSYLRYYPVCDQCLMCSQPRMERFLLCLCVLWLMVKGNSSDIFMPHYLQYRNYSWRAFDIIIMILLLLKILLLIIFWSSSYLRVRLFTLVTYYKRVVPILID